MFSVLLIQVPVKGHRDLVKAARALLLASQLARDLQ